MEVANLIIDSNASVGKNLILVAIKPSYVYADGKRSDQLEGFRYDLVLPERSYDKLSVKIAGEQKLELSEGETQFVTLDGLSLKLYWSPQGHKVSATADNIRLTTTPKKVQ
ncbi:MAG: hypothetical protein MRZ25_01355 [Ruminococcus sp.]|nr:hypothetical protein [Ruminococcus sp.]